MANCVHCSIKGGHVWPRCLVGGGSCGRVIPNPAKPPEGQPITVAVANDPIEAHRVMPWEAPLTAIVNACGGLPKPAQAAEKAKRKLERKKETRKSISVSRGCYDKLKPAAAAAGLSMSAIIELETNRFFGDDDAET